MMWRDVSHGSSAQCFPVFSIFSLPQELWAQPSLWSSKVFFLIYKPRSIFVKFRCGFSTILAETCCNLFPVYYINSFAMPPKKRSYKRRSTNPRDRITPMFPPRRQLATTRTHSRTFDDCQYDSTVRDHIVPFKIGGGRGIGGENTAQFKPFTRSSHSWTV